MKRLLWLAALAAVVVFIPSLQADDKTFVTEDTLRKLSSIATLRDVGYGTNGTITPSGRVKAIDPETLMFRRVREVRALWDELQKTVRERHLQPAMQQIGALSGKRRVEAAKRNAILDALMAEYKRGRETIHASIAAANERRRAVSEQMAGMSSRDGGYESLRSQSKQIRAEISRLDEQLKRLRTTRERGEQRATTAYERTVEPILKAIAELTEQRQELRRRMAAGGELLQQKITAYRADPSKALSVDLPSGPGSTVSHTLDAISSVLGINGSTYANAILHLASEGRSWTGLPEGAEEAWGDQLADAYGLDKVATIPVEDLLSGELNVPEGVFLFDARDGKGIERKPTGNGQVGFVASDAKDRTRQYVWSKETDGLASGDFKSYLHRTPFAQDEASEVRFYELSGHKQPVYGPPSKTSIRKGQISTIPFEKDKTSVRIRGQVKDGKGRPVYAPVEIGVEDGARQQSRVFCSDEDGSFEYDAPLPGSGFYDFRFHLPDGQTSNYRVGAYDPDTEVAVLLSDAIPTGSLSESEIAEVPGQYQVHTSEGTKRGKFDWAPVWDYTEALWKDIKADTGSHVLLAGTIVATAAIPFTAGASAPVAIVLGKMTAGSYATTAGTSTAKYAIDKAEFIPKEQKERYKAGVDAGVLLLSVVTMRGDKFYKSTSKAVQTLKRFNYGVKAVKGAEITGRLVTGDDNQWFEGSRLIMGFPDGYGGMIEALMKLDAGVK